MQEVACSQDEDWKPVEQVLHWDRSVEIEGIQRAWEWYQLISLTL